MHRAPHLLVGTLIPLCLLATACSNRSPEPPQEQVNATTAALTEILGTANIPPLEFHDTGFFGGGGNTGIATVTLPNTDTSSAYTRILENYVASDSKTEPVTVDALRKKLSADNPNPNPECQFSCSFSLPITLDSTGQPYDLYISLSEENGSVQAFTSVSYAP